ncbi:MAG: S9 family peptidase [bacterium]
MQISPDGKHLAALAPLNGYRNIVVINIDDLTQAKPLTGFDSFDVRTFFWGNDNRIVFTLDKEGMESFALYSVNREGGKVKTLIEPQVSIGARAIRAANVINVLKNDDEHILVSYNKRHVKYPDIYKLNIVTGKKELLAKNNNRSIGSITDHDGVVRARIELDDLNYEIFYRDTAEDDWRSIYVGNSLEESMGPIGFDYDNKTLYFSSNIGRDKMAIYTYDIANNKLGEMLFGHDEVDVNGPLFSYADKKLIGFSYTTDKNHLVYTDPTWKGLQESLDAAFPDDVVRISSLTDDAMRAIVAVGSDIKPVSYYLLDRKAGNMRFLVNTRDWIKPEEMAPMKPIQYTARDGLTIHGYLTLPRDYKEGDKVPLIVNPHGGPFGPRDNWRFNDEHQLFANRGYATLQMNFRGSGGYGHKFQAAGWGQWGKDMQNDITDAVNWAVKEGFADKNKVCIYGASYGGYATMAGLTFTPELYKCGINYVGVTDMNLLYDTMPEAWEVYLPQMKIQNGDPNDKAMMDAISPLRHVEKIQAPVLIIHGQADPRVNYKHATKLRSEMESHDKPYEWLMKKKEGHGFYKEENRLEAYTMMDEFLAKYLK